MSPVYRRVLKLSRIAHVYLTLFGLIVILFFAVTGFMLNHPHWFLPKSEDLDQDKPTATGSVPKELLAPLDRLAVVEHLRRQFRISGYLGGDPRQMHRDDLDEKIPRAVPRARDVDFLFPLTEQPVRLKFAQPGKLTDVKLWLEDEPAKTPDADKPDEPQPPPKKAGDVEVYERNEGAVGVMLDLHKSKASGFAWAWLIDITCLLLLLISITGLVLWSSLKTRAKWGGVWILVGGAVAYAVYHFGVP